MTASAEATVFVVDDDEAVRDALAMLFRAAGLGTQTFDSAAAFLEGAKLGPRCCLVLDVRMPGQSGLALQQELAARGERIPILFVTGHGDVPMAVEAVKRGAFDFIEKPFDGERLLSQVKAALGQPGVMALSGRERQVLDLVLAGKRSREIAVELHISAKTVEFHRARIMGKFGVRTVAQLFRACLGRGN